jgi:glycosyltransferase involved in cell wall biosynthesis
MEVNRIKLLKFLHTFEIGGTEQHVSRLVHRLDPAKFELSMGCFFRNGPFLRDIERLQIPVTEYIVRSLRSRAAFKEGMRCAADIRRNQIQIVHTYNFYSNIFGIPAAKVARVPAVIASIRDTLEFPPMQSRAHKFVCRLADCVLVNAEAIRRQLISAGYNGEKIQVIKNGIDLSRFASNEDAGKVRYEFGISPSAPVVVVLSRLSRVKGIEYFLEAAAAVSRRFEAARFLIVGGFKEDPNYIASLKRQAIRLGLGRRVIFTGFRLDVAEVLSDADVSVLPCHTGEGLSNALLESMAAGLPIVATTVGGNPEVVEEGATGLLVPPRDSESLARAISSLLADPEMARRFGAAGRERAARHFSIDRMVRETESLYLKLAEKTAWGRTHKPNTKRSRPGDGVDHPRHGERRKEIGSTFR